MRFMLCYSQIQKKGFFICKVFFPYDGLQEILFFKQIAFDFLIYKYYFLFFEYNAYFYNFNLLISNQRAETIKLFAYLLSQNYTIHNNSARLYQLHIIKLYNIYHYRGLRIAQKLPANGQRTHSNSAVDLKKIYNFKLLF